MSSGPSLYRRHRPRSFAEVVGQDHVVRTLRNAVERGKVHHAYLFVGSRGTGKTSMAKILAACLNCEQGPTTEPCGACDSCRAIASATSLDVIEMDAASNNSVDDIRDLRESVAYAPVSGRHKVYILDEAHMLSPQAWNAFLKTLEEPPPSTIFVLATTDAQKVLPTVVDRCHRFDFQRPSMDQIADVVRRAAGAESIELPDEAVALIARAATGSFRDALGTLEQLVTYSGQSIALDDVLAVLGVTDADLLLEACDAVESGDARRALQAVARLSESGRDAAAFARDLEVHARELLVIDTLGEVPPQVALTPDADARRADQARRLGRGAIVRLLDLLAAAMEAIKAGADARTQVELALVKAAAPEVDASLRAVLARLERLESAAGVGAASATASTPVEMPPAPADAPPPPEAAAEPREEALATVAVSVGQTATAVAAAALAVTEPAHAPAEDAPDLDVLTGLWPGVLETIGAENSLLAAVLADARPVGLAGTELRIGFPPSAAFLCRKAEDQANRDAVMRALRALTGHALNVAYTLREDDPAEVEAGSPPPSEEEWIARFKAEFDAEELVDPSEEEGAPEDPARPVAARQEGEAP